MKEIIIRYKFIVYLLRLLNPGLGYCKHCGLPWNYCNGYTVWTSDQTNGYRTGSFAVCDRCWSMISLRQAIQYHIMVYHNQELSLIRASMLDLDNLHKYKVEYTIEHLIECVTKEYKRTHNGL